MIALAGYYDGATIQLLEKANLRKNQRLIITVMDELTEQDASSPKTKAEMKSAAFERLESWRKKNQDFFGSDFDWKKEVREAIHEKYGLAD